ncbi:protein disulfide-isomerase [Colletotrichum plurivorum]|uniref:protein disulfide-isomerase n=1 Tax=Colletotrichum plurivorum TaxID=2175906 RepID=A0A8H6K8L3_9PEZI|nr:protein disulfide-isomerase [Colletotrichum plurivorum]
MHHPTILAAAGVAVLSALPGAQAGMYTKNSPVLQLDARSYERLIANSNHTSIVEFYAPWCGHCQNLKPAYEKAAKNLDGLAKVAAIDCDDDSNKPFCGGMGVQGFPTLKIVRPGKKPGKPVVEDYQGPRTATGIVEAVVDKITNHVKRVTDKDLDSFLEGDKPKAILFTEKGTTSALLRSVAIDFLDVVSVGQVRSKEKAAVEKFGVKSFPTLVLVPGGDKEPITYDGELKKKGLVEFISQVAEPNPDPAPAKKKADKKSEKKAEKKSKSSSSTKPAATEEATPEPEAATETPAAEEPAAPVVNAAPPIPVVAAPDALQQECLNAKSHTCVLAFVPTKESEKAEKALKSLAEIAQKHKGQRKLFPFFAVPEENTAGASVVKGLSLSGEVEIVAMNARRNWWRHYEGDFEVKSVEDWVDAIRLGEGAKQKLPDGIVVEEAEATPESTASTAATEPTPEAETEAPKEEATEPPAEHDEL